MKVFFLLCSIGTGYGLYGCLASLPTLTRAVDVVLVVFASVVFLLLFLFGIVNLLVLMFEAKKLDSRSGRLNVTYYILPDSQIPTNANVKVYRFYLVNFREETGRYRARMLFFPPWRLVLISNRTEIAGDKDTFPFLKDA